MKKKSLKHELDNAKCACPACNNPDTLMFMHSHCHPESPMWVAYNKNLSRLIVSCAECEKIVSELTISDPT